MRAPLPLGRVVATPGVLRLLSEAREDLFGYLARHATGDWGELCAFDRRQNEIASVLAIVPGDRTVTARCDSCWRYGNPRDFVEVSPGGRKNAYSGTCGACTEEGG